MCKECPFRDSSPPGWLGPYKDPLHFVEDAFHEDSMACHMDVSAHGEDSDKLRVCAGAIQCANRTAKRFVNPVLLAAQDAIRGSEEPDVMSKWQFVEHHNLNDSSRRDQDTPGKS